MAFLLLFGLFAALALRHAGAETHGIMDRAHASAQGLARAVDVEIEAARALLSALASSPSIRSGDLAAFQDQLAATKRPPGSWFVLQDLNAEPHLGSPQPFCTAVPAMGTIAPAQGAAPGRPHAGDPFFGRVGDLPVVAVPAPVVHTGAAAYLLSLIIPSHELGRLLAPNLEEGWVGSILDPNGRVIASTGSPGRPVGSVVPREILDQARPGSLELPSTADAEGVARVIARPANALWTAAVELPQATIEAPRRRTMALITGSGLFFALAGGLLAFIAGRDIAGGFRTLREAVAATTREKDDLQTLYRTYFNNTTEALFIVEVTHDQRFVFEGLNPEHERLTGLRSHELRGKEPHECLAPDVAAWVTANYRRCVEASVSIRYDEVLSLPGGTRTWETSLVPVRDPVSGRICRLLGSARDITERHAVFDALRESEDRFRAVADTVPDVLFVLDGRGTPLYANARFYEYTGLPDGTVDRTRWLDTIHPDDVSSMRRSISGAFECEFRMRAGDGSYRWFVGRSRPIRDQSGRIVKLFGTATDVDDLKRAQAALESSNQRMRSILASISDSYLALDREGRFTDVNAHAAAWIGLPPDAIIGRLADELFPHNALVEHIRGAIARSEPVHVEYPSTLKPGRWIDLHVYPLPEGASVFFRDITTRKSAELALARARELLQSTMDSLSAHIAILDAEGTIIAVNAAWRRFAETYGMNVENAGVGTNYLRICGATGPTGDAASAVEAGLRAILAGQHTEFRFEYPCRYGSEERWFQLRATRFGEGEAMRLVLAHENITEIMQAERALRQLAGRLLRAQDEERRRIARDLHDSTAQNLLGAALGVERALRLAPDLPDRARTALLDSQALIEQSQQENRTVSYQLHPPMLDEMGLPSALRWYVEGFMKRSGIAVQVLVSERIEGRRFPLDIEAALFRVLQECLTNVHRHSGSKTASIELSVDGAMPSTERLVLRVEDQGRGMLRAKGATSSLVNKPGMAQAGSVGVGLGGMRERLRQLGGNLEVWSGPRGTTVRATVPLEGVVAARRPQLAPAEPA